MLSDQFQRASQKIGTSIGVQLAEGEVDLSFDPEEQSRQEVPEKSNENAPKLAPKAKIGDADL